MSHCDETTIALAALGEDIPADEAAHLHGCSLCTADVAELIAIVTVGREALIDLPEVPGNVWTGIRQELSLSRAPAGHNALAGVQHLPTPRASHAEPGTDAPNGVLLPLARRHGPGPLWRVGAVAAAAGALVGGAVMWSAVERGGSGGGSPEQFLAQAVLAPLTASVPSPGKATVLDSADGEVVRVDARSLPTSDGFYEVWLLDANATKLVALGALTAGSVGTFTVPPGLSIDDFPVVDISLESYDGDPSHSKQSLMRGTLET